MRWRNCRSRVAVQPVAQFRLAHQNDLQQLPVVRLDVGKQTHLFEQIFRQILRLVNDKHRLLAVLDLLQQKFADGRNRFQPVLALHVQPEFRRDGLHQFIRVQHRVQDQRRGKMRVQLLQQRAAQRRLARADLARELHKTLALADAVEQMVERLAML